VGESQALRLARASQALKQAEVSTGTRPVSQAGLDRSLDPPRLRLVAAQDGGTSQCTLDEVKTTAAALLAPGQVAQVTGSTSALLAVAAGVWQAQTWGALAHLPDLGYLAAAQAGVALERAVVVPDLGDGGVKALASLIDAFGVVVLGDSWTATASQAADRRRLEARLRHHQGYLVTSGQWPGAQLKVEISQISHRSLGQGDGLLEAGWLDVRWSGAQVLAAGQPHQPPDHQHQQDPLATNQQPKRLAAI